MVPLLWNILEPAVSSVKGFKSCVHREASGTDKIKASSLAGSLVNVCILREASS